MVFRDITNERRAQNALLATEKLAVAGRLAATIAHEIHNPLDSVVNLLYLIKEEKDPSNSDHFLSLAQQELDRMGQVSRAMLGLYREAKAPIALNIKEMLDSVLVLVDRQLKNGQIAVRRTCPDNLEIEGFPAELRQVFTNLVVNAADAAAPGGRITVDAARSTSAGNQTGIAISVSDTGPGIDSVALDHVFEPFFTTKGERGTGLGLWVSRGIIEKHGGTIDIQSRTGADDHGTCITVFLPTTGPAATSV
jgi:signal transduction histidine kinase